jgi:hypothetical protein
VEIAEGGGRFGSGFAAHPRPLLATPATCHIPLTTPFSDAALPAPSWERSAKGAIIALTWPSPLPWDEPREAEQQVLLKRGANQLVSSFRPRLERIGTEA